ncbi:bacteriophage tail protein [Neoasaia chiangmaiensis NBRC 101099]|uniref:Phage tail protein n=1 Tax=Neoasaia chiangmaiensis TaxID=320497 RepID=A0A1U9KRA8_9PROT|nr:putative phage tail protein [Neoasaia chiangmaiensis]AQS88279.1 phage tail protein [Neoasaia chiangmaiensis]GBR39668.1 bacteriophage tail protein [Neoasaia chiangmaiensis NBRC 101099]GEN14687.1 tail protein [Neoasaia chiangmaiensis]
MSNITFSAEAFRQALLRLLPSGAIWSRDPDALPSRLAGVWGRTFFRNGARAANLLTDAFPATAVELLPEWEASLGLPDPCAGTDPTIASRQRQVVTRLTDSGGSSIAYFTAFAASLGYDITITEFVPARVDIMTVEEPLYDESWAYAWQVNAPASVVSYFEVDQSYVEEPLASWGSSALECELRARVPAHTIIIFSYSGQGAVGIWDAGIWGRDSWG